MINETENTIIETRENTNLFKEARFQTLKAFAISAKCASIEIYIKMTFGENDTIDQRKNVIYENNRKYVAILMSLIENHKELLLQISSEYRELMYKNDSMEQKDHLLKINKLCKEVGQEYQTLFKLLSRSHFNMCVNPIKIHEFMDMFCSATNNPFSPYTKSNEVEYPQYIVFDDYCHFLLDIKYMIFSIGCDKESYIHLMLLYSDRIIQFIFKGIQEKTTIKTIINKSKYEKMEIDPISKQILCLILLENYKKSKTEEDLTIVKQITEQDMDEMLLKRRIFINKMNLTNNIDDIEKLKNQQTEQQLDLLQFMTLFEKVKSLDESGGIKKSNRYRYPFEYSPNKSWFEIYETYKEKKDL